MQKSRDNRDTDTGIAIIGVLNYILTQLDLTRFDFSSLGLTHLLDLASLDSLSLELARFDCVWFNLSRFESLWLDFSWV